MMVKISWDEKLSNDGVLAKDITKENFYRQIQSEEAKCLDGYLRHDSLIVVSSVKD